MPRSSAAGCAAVVSLSYNQSIMILNYVSCAGDENPAPNLIKF
jgi:hypothetical protein